MDPSSPLSTTDRQEFGNPIDNPKIYDLIRNYSPTRNISKLTLSSTDIWITAGLYDERIPLSQSLEFVQRLRRLSIDKDAKYGDLVLNLSERGHEDSHDHFQQATEYSMELAFLLDSFNKENK